MPVPRSSIAPEPLATRASRAGRFAFVASLIVLGAAGATWVATSDLQQDFAAYYTAGVARMRGLDPYINYLSKPDGPWDGVAIYRHSRFLYPPLVADLFRCFALLPFRVAKALFTALSLVALALAGGSQGSSRAKNWAVAAAFLPVALALERGQVDLLLLPLLMTSWRARTTPVRGGFTLAFVVMFKPVAIGLLPMLACARQGRWLLWTCVGLFGFASLNVVVCGWASSRAYVADVIPRTTAFGEGGPADWLIREAPSADTREQLAQGLARPRPGDRVYVQDGADFPRNASLARWASPDGQHIRALSAALYLLFALPLAWRAFRTPESSGWFWGTLVAAILAAPVSWAMSLTWALPLLWRQTNDTTSASLLNAPSVAKRCRQCGWIAITAGPWWPFGFVVGGLALMIAACTEHGPTEIPT